MQHVSNVNFPILTRISYSLPCGVPPVSAVDGKPSRSGRPGEQRQETGGPGRAGRGEVCGAFPPGRARHQCGVCGRFGAVDYESDRASVGSDGTAVYPGWKPVSGEQHGQAGAVVPSAQCASNASRVNQTACSLRDWSCSQVRDCHPA